MATAMPFVGAGLSLVGGFVKAAGDVAGANAGSAAVLSAARMNQQFMQQQADTETQLGGIAYQRMLRQGLIYKGKSLAVMADAGIDPTQGTPLDIISQQAAESEYAAEVQRFGYAEQAWKLSTQGMLDIEQADVQSGMYQQRGQAAAIGDIIGGVTGAATSSAINWGGGSTITTPSPTAQPAGTT
jgi:hypothetical protein